MSKAFYPLPFPIPALQKQYQHRWNSPRAWAVLVSVPCTMPAFFPSRPPAQRSRHPQCTACATAGTPCHQEDMQLIALGSIQSAGNSSCLIITKVLTQHTLTTVYPPNDNSLPQIHTLFVPPIRVITALLPLLPPSPIHSSSTLPLPS